MHALKSEMTPKKPLGKLTLKKKKQKTPKIRVVGFDCF